MVDLHKVEGYRLSIERVPDGIVVDAHIAPELAGAWGAEPQSCAIAVFRDGAETVERVRYPAALRDIVLADSKVGPACLAAGRRVVRASRSLTQLEGLRNAVRDAVARFLREYARPVELTLTVGMTVLRREAAPAPEVER